MTSLRGRTSVPITSSERLFLSLPEAYELVEGGLLTHEDFRDFTFANAVRLWGTQNPKFFEGTAVAKAAAEVLAETSGRVTAGA